MLSKGPDEQPARTRGLTATTPGRRLMPGAGGRGRLERSLIGVAQRQVRSAVLIALLSGTLSLIVGLRTWNERVYIDLETLLGLADAVVVLSLAILLSRGSRVATVCLLLLALMGMAFTLWKGLPPLALMPQLVAGIFYARAISAQRFINRIGGQVSGAGAAG